MKVRASTLDDLLNDVFRRLIKSGRVIYPSRGRAFETSGALLELTNPRARMSRTEARAVIFSWIGELLWYLAGSDEFSFVHYYVKEYKPDYVGAKTVGAAYGPRLRAKNRDRLKWVVDLIKSRPDTRRAVIPIYHPGDMDSSLPEVPCTCTLQFLLRDHRLELITHMRSNDAFIGLPGDIFAFTMMQEIVATALNVEPGHYRHLVGSLHLYDSDAKKAMNYLAEGYQEKVSMPVMPSRDPFGQLDTLLRFESATRLGRHPKVPSSLDLYWQDLAMLLSIFRASSKDGVSGAALRSMRNHIHSDAYNPYIEKRQRRAEKREVAPAVPAELPFEGTPNA